jgi:hypothetical protein
MAQDALVTYLNDHLGGSAAALQLLEHLVDREPGESKAFFAGLLEDVSADRATLEDIIHRLGDSSAVRVMGGWLLEKANRVKLMWDDPSGNALKELEALELLQIGIHGKASLWRALRRVSPRIAALRDVDFRRLEQRADEQHARVEARRLASAERVLTAGRTADSRARVRVH